MTGLVPALAIPAALAVVGGLRRGSASRIAELRKLAGQPVAEIGHGAFSTAYRTQDGKTVCVVVKEGAWDKEILHAAHGYLIRNPHIPAVRFVDALDSGERVYRMPWYETPLRATHREAWAAFRALKEAADKADRARDFYSRHNVYDGAYLMQDTMKIVKPKITKRLYAALEEIFDQTANYGTTWRWEFAPRNLAVDGKGNLVLLDPVYDAERLSKMREEKYKRRQAQRPGWRGWL